MLIYVCATIAGAAAGASMAVVLLWWHDRQARTETVNTVEPIDPWVEAEIDRAAVNWATAQGRPEAASLVADKLRLLHRLGTERGWS